MVICIKDIMQKQAIVWHKVQEFIFIQIIAKEKKVWPKVRERKHIIIFKASAVSPCLKII